MKYFIVTFLCVSAVLALPQQKGTKKIPVRNLHGRIINGEEAAPGQFPWQVALSINAIFYSSFCGGSIIDDEWILTAGHCVADADSIDASAGSIDVDGGDVYSSVQIIQHEDYDEWTLENDLGLVKVSAIAFSDNVKAVTVNYDDVIDAGVELTVSGWGLTSDSSSTVSPVLNFVKLVSIDNAACGDEYSTDLYDGNICANGGDSADVKSTCNGDSGGPLVNADNEQVGVVSFGHVDGCESGHSAGFTRTSFFADWIQNQISSK